MKRRGHALRRRYGRAYPPAFAQKGARYEIYGLAPKHRGGGFAKKRHLVGRGRDAYEALAELYRLEHGEGVSRWMYIVIDKGAGAGRLAPVVTRAELEQRRAAEQRHATG
jgi:hypothetical protein